MLKNGLSFKQNLFSPVSRPSAKHKQGPKVISAIENTFTIDGNIETGIEMGSECQEVSKLNCLL